MKVLSGLGTMRDSKDSVRLHLVLRKISFELGIKNYENSIFSVAEFFNLFFGMSKKRCSPCAISKESSNS